MYEGLIIFRHPKILLRNPLPGRLRLAVNKTGPLQAPSGYILIVCSLPSSGDPFFSAP